MVGTEPTAQPRRPNFCNDALRRIRPTAPALSLRGLLAAVFPLSLSATANSKTDREQRIMVVGLVDHSDLLPTPSRGRRPKRHFRRR